MRPHRTALGRSKTMQFHKTVHEQKTIKALYLARLGIFEDGLTVPIANALHEENFVRRTVKQEVNVLTHTDAASFTSSTRASHSSKCRISEDHLFSF